MVQSADYMDVADSDFLSNNKELDDEDSEFETVFEKYFVLSAAENRFFRRRRPLHVVLGSGKIADIILWRNKRITASILVSVTFTWLIFKAMDYTLISFICDSLIVILLAMLFLWTHLPFFIKISPPKLSACVLSEGFVVKTAFLMTKVLNQLLRTFGALASRHHDFKKFLLITSTLGALSVLGKLFTAATIIYIASAILLTVPAVYERHQHIIDIIFEKALTELSTRYAELMKKFFRNSQYMQDNILE